LQFVVEADELPSSEVLEQFKTELGALLAKFNLRFAPQVGLNNSEAVKQSVRRPQLKQDRAETPDDAADALYAECNRLNGEYVARVQRRVEQAVRRLIGRQWKAKFGAALRATKGMKFPNQKARWRYATKRTGIERDEVTGGTLDAGAAWVNRPDELDMMMDRDGRSDAVRMDAGGAPSTSMLLQAVEIGSDSAELFTVIKAERDRVRVPKRLQQLGKALEDVQRRDDELHRADIQADIDRQREFVKRSSRLRRMGRWSNGATDPPSADAVKAPREGEHSD